MNFNTWYTVSNFVICIYKNVQALMEENSGGNENKEKLEWFVNLMKRILRMMPCAKQRALLVCSLFDVWGKTILGLHDDIHAAISSKVNSFNKK